MVRYPSNNSPSNLFHRFPSFLLLGALILITVRVVLLTRHAKTSSPSSASSLSSSSFVSTSGMTSTMQAAGPPMTAREALARRDDEGARIAKGDKDGKENEKHLQETSKLKEELVACNKEKEKQAEEGGKGELEALKKEMETRKKVHENDQYELKKLQEELLKAQEGKTEGGGEKGDASAIKGENKELKKQIAELMEEKEKIQRDMKDKANDHKEEQHCVSKSEWSTLERKQKDHQWTIDEQREQLTQASKQTAEMTGDIQRLVTDVVAAQGRKPDELLAMPGWTHDYRFYVLGTVLTRDQVDQRLYADIMLAGRVMFDRQSTVLGVRGLKQGWLYGKYRYTKDSWQLHKEGAKFYCESLGETKTLADHVPTLTTIDWNANGEVQVVRCPVSEKAEGVGEDFELKLTLHETSKQIEEDNSFTKAVARRTQEGDWHVSEVGRMMVSRKTRGKGFFNYERPGTSKLDAWQKKPDRMHLCIPGIYSTFGCPMVETILEFTEYHLSMDIQHIHFGVDYDWYSKDMENFLKAMRPYIEEGKVSVVSTRLEGPDWIGTDQNKLYHINSCLHYTKGLAEYVGVWDTDEFLVPRVDIPNRSIPDFIEKEFTKINKTKETGCHLFFTSYSHIFPSKAPGNRLWNGQLFAHSREAESTDVWQKTVVNNRNVYFTGFHIPGGCRADGREWESMMSWEEMEPFRPNKTTAAMMHYRSKGGGGSFLVTQEVEDDEYASLWFPKVLEGLKEKKADDVVNEICGRRPSMEL